MCEVKLECACASKYSKENSNKISFTIEEHSLPNGNSAIRRMLDWNNKSLCLPYYDQSLISIYDHYHFAYKVYLADNETLCSSEVLIIH